INDRFDHQFAQWKKLDEEYYLISHQLNRLDLRLDALEEGLRRVEKKMDDHDTILAKLETKLNNNETILTRHETILGRLETEIRELHEKLGALQVLALENERKSEETTRNIQLLKANLPHDEAESRRLMEDKAEIQQQFWRLERRIEALEK